MTIETLIDKINLLDPITHEILVSKVVACREAMNKYATGHGSVSKYTDATYDLYVMLGTLFPGYDEDLYWPVDLDLAKVYCR